MTSPFSPERENACMSSDNPEYLRPIALGRRISHLTPEHTRIEFKDSISNNTQTPNATIISTPSGTLEITYPETGKPDYHFRRSVQVPDNLQRNNRTNTGLDGSRNWVDPRRWLHIVDGQDLPTLSERTELPYPKIRIFQRFPVLCP